MIQRRSLASPPHLSVDAVISYLESHHEEEEIGRTLSPSNCLLARAWHTANLPWLIQQAEQGVSTHILVFADRYYLSTYDHRTFEEEASLILPLPPVLLALSFYFDRRDTPMHMQRPFTPVTKGTFLLHLAACQQQELLALLTPPSVSPINRERQNVALKKERK